MKENEVTCWGKFSQKDLENLKFKLKEGVEQDHKRKQEWLKEREVNRKALNKKAKELKQQEIQKIEKKKSLELQIERLQTQLNNL